MAITPDLAVFTVVEDPDGAVLQAPSSVGWGGCDNRDLYIGSLFGTHVVKTRSRVPGMTAVGRA